LKDLIIRTGTNKLVADLVALDRVRSMLKTISERRRFLARLQKAREAAAEHGTYFSLNFSLAPPFARAHVDKLDNVLSTLDLPEIVVVDDIPSTPPPLPPVSSRDITSARRLSSSTNWTEPETPFQRDQFDLLDLAPIGGSVGAGSSPSLSSRGLRRDRRSDMSALSADLGLRYTYVPPSIPTF
jgi:hypothetical protein